MPRSDKLQLVNDEIYHIVARTVDGVDLFRDKTDYLRMIHDLFEFNDTNPAPSTFRSSIYRNNSNATRAALVALESARLESKQDNKRRRDLLVEILAFCLMQNHIHLLVRQLKDRGISKFMQKFGGYASYYNKRHQRKGHLFQNRYYGVHIESDEQLKTVFVYIHTNPVSLIYPGWKEKGIKNPRHAIKFVENYRWSSYKDYLGNKSFPSLTSRGFLMSIMGETGGCKKFVNGWLRHKQELVDFASLAIE